MAISQRNNLFLSPSILSRMHTLISVLQRPKHTFAGEVENTRFHGDTSARSAAEKGRFDSSTWKAVDSRIVGITKSMISSPVWIVLKILQNKGFEAYLVGGCVRDLLLKRIPKDFDVVTTAKLKQIKKQFRHSQIVGRRFPICRVNIQDSVVEVSSFETTGKNVKENETDDFSQMRASCDKKDFLRWKNCMKRDFTINGLFYDPFVNTIYDYADGIRDLKMCKVQTIIPAQVAFKEDCARILRGLRIAARLGLQFSKETAIAIRDLSTTIMNLDKSRLMMELNFMLAYGAAESSFRLLHRFKLLELMLPIHGAYLATQDRSAQSSIMLMVEGAVKASSNPLAGAEDDAHRPQRWTTYKEKKMEGGRDSLSLSPSLPSHTMTPKGGTSTLSIPKKLFSSMDKLLACDRPTDCSLWVGLLAFHLALLKHPQDALVVWTLSSILYYGSWTKAVEVARENAQMRVQFIPEISETFGSKSNESLQEEVSDLASLVKSSIGALTSTNTLIETMARYPLFPCSGLVLVSERMGKIVSELFDVLETDIKSYASERECFDIDYKRLGKGDQRETRFVLGKIIMDTMSSGIVRELTTEPVKAKQSHRLSNLFV